MWGVWPGSARKATPSIYATHAIIAYKGGSLWPRRALTLVLCRPPTGWAKSRAHASPPLITPHVTFLLDVLSPIGHRQYLHTLFSAVTGCPITSGNVHISLRDWYEAVGILAHKNSHETKVEDEPHVHRQFSWCATSSRTQTAAYGHRPPGGTCC